MAFSSGTAKATLAGPQGTALPVSIFWNREGKAATIDLDGTTVRLEEGEWSKWIPVDFSHSFFARPTGLIQFCLVHAASTFALYASPINWNPNHPPAPLSSPARFASDLYERVGTYTTLGWPEPTSALDAGLIDERAFMASVDRAFDDRAQIMLQRIDTRKWDLLVGEIDAVDHVQHVMWRLMDPAHPAHDRATAANFSNAIERLYRRCDDLIGEILAHVGTEASLLVVSVYGEHGVTQTFDLNRWLAEEHLPGPATATAAGGIVLAPETRATADHLVARLTALLDPATRMPFVAAVYKRDAVYSGPYAASAPDLQIGLIPGYGLGAAPTVLALNKRRWSADHAAIDYKSVPGTLLSSRPTMTDTPKVIDIAPTVLRYFGLPIPGEIDGTPLF